MYTPEKKFNSSEITPNEDYLEKLQGQNKEVIPETVESLELLKNSSIAETTQKAEAFISDGETMLSRGLFSVGLPNFDSAFETGKQLLEPIKKKALSLVSSFGANLLGFGGAGEFINMAINSHVDKNVGIGETLSNNILDVAVPDNTSITEKISQDIKQAPQVINQNSSTLENTNIIKNPGFDIGTQSPDVVDRGFNSKAQETHQFDSMLRDLDTLSDEQYTEKYNESKHAVKYRVDPIYREQSQNDGKEAREQGSGSIDYPPTDIRSQSYTGNPNLDFYTATQNTPEGKREMEQYHMDIIGSAMPIPGVDEISGGKQFGEILKEELKLTHVGTVGQNAEKAIEHVVPRLEKINVDDVVKTKLESHITEKYSQELESVRNKKLAWVDSKEFDRRLRHQGIPEEKLTSIKEKIRKNITEGDVKIFDSKNYNELAGTLSQYGEGPGVSRADIEASMGMHIDKSTSGVPEAVKGSVFIKEKKIIPHPPLPPLKNSTTPIISAEEKELKRISESLSHEVGHQGIEDLNDTHYHNIKIKTKINSPDPEYIGTFKETDTRLRSMFNSLDGVFDPEKEVFGKKQLLLLREKAARGELNPDTKDLLDHYDDIDLVKMANRFPAL